ncbi:hypothetical protein WAI453_009806 [Rhynchosporium graminicola]
MAMLHCRESFEDGGDHYRHLLRLWLNNQDSMWERDPALKVAWARVFDDTECGTYWDAMPVWLDGKIIKAESCD